MSSADDTSPTPLNIRRLKGTIPEVYRNNSKASKINGFLKFKFTRSKNDLFSKSSLSFKKHKLSFKKFTFVQKAPFTIPPCP